MPVGDRIDPFLSHQFLVEIDGITRASFQGCSGLDSSQDPVDYREGNDPLTARKIPGLNKYSHITLKRGMTGDSDLWEWRKKVMDGKVDRRNGSIVLTDEKNNEKMRWNFTNAWPVKWTGPTFNATGNDVAIEQLELVHEGVVKA
jgi:phage tail-like protein